ncbi:YfcC family protein [Puteibacter caeruleilacunae]|nr:YfcC family protein [Puteibacter caeruleilacunae]
MFKKVPHTYVIVFSIIVLAGILTWIIPGGEFERTTTVVNGVEREIIKGDSFHQTESHPQTWEILSAFFKGFVNTADIIVFILMIGGAFWILNDSKAIDVGIYSFLEKAKQLEKHKLLKKLGIENIIITLIMLVFSVFGAVFGMSEETIAFIIIFVPLAISMGYDSIVGICLCFVAAGLGFAGAVLNPFTIGIAQGLSNIPLFSGIEYRLFCWIAINLVGIIWILRYARKIKKDPQKSVVYESDAYWRNKETTEVEDIITKPGKHAWGTFIFTLAIMIIFSVMYPNSILKIGNAEFSAPAIPVTTALFAITSFLALRKTTHFFVLNLLFFTIFFLIIGVMGYSWYVMEIATIFLAMGLLAGMAMGNDANRIVKLFIDGTKDILSAALVVGLAGGIVVILNQGNIIDPILNSIAESMKDMGSIASVGMMYIFQTILNVIIPSGSGKAALTMPIMSQFSDLIGISRQATVMAFQFGDGFTNMITPTSPVLIGVLGVAKIPFDKWVKWIGPFMLVLIALGFLLLIPTVTMQLNGF